MLRAVENLASYRTLFIMFCWCIPSLAHAGPEPDASYKLIISLGAVLSVNVLFSIATGFLALSLKFGFWRWFSAQFVASLCGLALFIRVLNIWQTALDMTVLDLVITDIIFETWSISNLLLFASVLAFTCPLLILSIYCLINRFHSSKTTQAKM